MQLHVAFENAIVVLQVATLPIGPLLNQGLGFEGLGSLEQHYPKTTHERLDGKGKHCNQYIPLRL